MLEYTSSCSHCIFFGGGYGAYRPYYSGYGGGYSGYRRPYYGGTEDTVDIGRTMEVTEVTVTTMEDTELIGHFVCFYQIR